MLHNAEQKGITLNRNDLAASLQSDIAAILTDKTIRAAQSLGYKKVALAGGVSANTGVRAALSEACKKHGFEFYMPLKSLCGDNGAMIACQGRELPLATVNHDELRKIVNIMKAKSVSNCETCTNYVYDEDYDCFVCMVNLDEDEMYRFLQGTNYSCPYYRLDDEYGVVRHQN